MSKEIDQVKEEIKLLRKEYKLSKKLAKKLYQANQEDLKKKLEEQSPETFSSKLIYQLDNLTLRLCKPFEDKATEIRYKRSNPSGYEADELVKACRPVVSHFERKLSKGKTLSEREENVLEKVRLALSLISGESLGKLSEEAGQLINRLNEAKPQQELSQLQDLVNSANQIGNMIEKLTGEKIESFQLPVEMELSS